MTDKVQKIREEVEMVVNRRLNLLNGDYFDLSKEVDGFTNELIDVIDSLQEETVSEDLNKAAKNYADNITDKIGYKLQLRRAVVYGAKWKEEQLEKNHLAHCDATTKEEITKSSITEDYVSFETAKLLKEKGFKGSGSHFYEKERLVDFHNYWWRITTKERYEAIEAPTLQMVMKWLREVHNISIEPLVDFGSGDEYWWTADVGYIKKDGLIDELCGYNSYEEACETAIKYCLENLI